MPECEVICLPGEVAQLVVQVFGDHHAPWDKPKLCVPLSRSDTILYIATIRVYCTTRMQVTLASITRAVRASPAWIDT